jgi:hypothetical protein
MPRAPSWAQEPGNHYEQALHDNAKTAEHLRGEVEKLDRRLTKHDNRPAARLDRTGLPDLHTLIEYEQLHRFRFSPRKLRWRDVLEYDQRIDELTQRQQDTFAARAEIQERLRGADAHDAVAHAEWIAAGSSGTPPAPTRPQLEGRIGELTREHDALGRLIGQAAREKGQFVHKHRRRLVRTAATAVAEQHKRVHELVDQLAEARDELAAMRERELWAHAYGHPDEEVTGMPPFSSFGAQSKHVHRLINAAGTVEYSRVLEALRGDADAIASVMTQAQRRVIAPSDQALPLSQMKTAVWESSKEGEAALRAEKEQQRSQHEKVWGRPHGGWDA